MMKKKIIACILVLILPILASCTRLTDIDVDETNYLSQIFEIDNGEMTETSNWVKHNNLISNRTVYSFEQSEKELTSYEINGQKFDVSYKNSLYFPVGNRKVHYYTFSDNDYLLLKEDGTLSTICGFSACERILGNVSIEQDASVENVYSALRTAISQVIRVDNYNKWKLTEKPSNNSGFYMFVFYNEINGYLCDYAVVILNADGRILRVTSVNEMNYTGLNLNVDEEWENKLLLAKLKDMYNTENNEYKSHVVHEKRITKYDDEICIKYDISVMASNLGERIELLIPLSVLLS